MFVLSGALVRTGAIDAVASAIVARASKHPRLAILEVMGGALIASGFMNKTPVVVILIPIMFRLSAATGVPVKKLLMPLYARNGVVSGKSVSVCVGPGGGRYVTNKQSKQYKIEQTT